MIRLLPICFLISINPLVLVSIRFDKYCDFDGSPVNEYWSFEIESKCQPPEEFCGVTCCCVLPPCVPIPVEKCQSRLQYILYCNDTSIYNNQLTEFTSSAHNLKKDVRNNNENVTNDKDKGKNESFYFGRNPKKEELYRHLAEIKNNISTEHFFNFLLEDQFNSTIKSKYQINQDIKKENLKRNTSEQPQQLKVILQNRYTFLLLNSTIEEPTLKNNLSEIYETLGNSEISKVLVKLLKEKLRSINEKEKLRKHSTSDVSSITTELDVSFITTQLPSQSPTPISKWDIVREFFLKKDKSKGFLPSSTTNENYLMKEESNNEDSDKNLFVIKEINENNEKTENEELRNKVDNYYNDNILKFLTENNEKADNSNDEVINYDTSEFFNINLPYDEEQEMHTENSELKHDYTTGKSNEIFENAASKFEDETSKLKVTLKQNNKSKSIFQRKNYQSTKTTTKYEEEKFVSVPAKISKSSKLSDKLTNLFVWHRKNDLIKEKKPLILNERFLLTLNAKNLSKKQSPELPKIHPTNKIKNLPDKFYSISYPISFESVSSESEDLYNSSFVFVMHKRNKTDTKKSAKWNSLLNFFNFAKEIPCPRGKNPCIESSNGACDFNNSMSDKNTLPNLQTKPEYVTKNTIETTTPKIIRLPEGLMPEALEGRQLNDTDSMFYVDSFVKEAEHNSSTNGTFFFFFK